MINHWLLFLISAMLLCSALMVVQSYITRVITLLVLQNVLLTGYLLAQAIQMMDSALWISCTIISIVKVIVLPWLLWKLSKFLQLSGRIEPIFNKPTLLIFTAGLVLLALMLGQDMSTVVPHPSIAGFSLALANAFIALLLVIVKQKTITQIIALLVLENSIFILAAALSASFPWLIELGISFDVLMGVMIFTLFLLRIQREHGSFHIHHVEKLTEHT